MKKIARADPLADLLEIRLDLMESFLLGDILGAATKPVIMTYRSKKEGGKGSTHRKTQIRYLLEAIEANADFVDVEYSMPLEHRDKIFRCRGGSKIILSAHLRNGTPPQEELELIFRRMVATGADLVKIVTQALSPHDNLRVMNLIPLAVKLDVKVITFCMGPLGRMSRILSPLLGGYLTFASLEAGEESADGQIPVLEMKKLIETFAW